MSIMPANGRGMPAVPYPDQIDYGDPSRPVVRYTINDIQVMARSAAASRMFGLDEHQALTLMLICDAEGLHPIQALRRYHCIQGRPAMRTDAMLGEMMRHGWTVEWTSDSRDRQAQEAVFTHAKKCPNGKSVSWTIEDAKAAGLAGKDNWRNHTPAMLRSRVISTACRMLDPGIVTGIYSSEEVEEFTSPAPAVESSRSRLQAALDAAKRVQPVPTAPPQRTAFGEWVDARVAQANEHVQAACRQAGVDAPRPITRQQVGNHLIKSWIESGLDEAMIKTDGKRDKAKVASALADAWEREPANVGPEVDAYLAEQVEEALRAAGIVRDEPGPAAVADDDSDLAAGMADEG